MIEVVVRLRSANGWRRDKELGRVIIVNDGTSDTDRLGDYQVYGQNGTAGRIKEARVEDFPRKTNSALKLLRLAMDALDAAEGL